MKTTARLFILIHLFAIPKLWAATACSRVGEFMYSATTGSYRFCNGSTYVNISGIANGGACASTGELKYSSGNLTVCDGAKLLIIATVAGTACSAAGKIQYNSPNLQYCNGTNWLTMNAAANYFVQTANLYNGNLGGMSGANSICLSELQSSAWLGKSNAILNSTSVKAFLCDASDGCQNLLPSTSYAFATAGSATSGGATLTTDASSIGPNDSANWSDSTHFNVAAPWWASRGNASPTQWANTPGTYNCANWTDATAANNGGYGANNSTVGSRYAYGYAACNNVFAHLVCMVNSP